MSLSDPRLKYTLSNEQGAYVRGPMIWRRESSPRRLTKIASPGATSWMSSASMLNVVCSTGRSEAMANTSPSLYQNAGRIPHGSRMQNISPEPVTPQST